MKLKEVVAQLDCYIVGGAVRDLIMGEKPNDIDYVVANSNHEEMILLGFKQVGANFPVYLWNESGQNIEFALCRQERKVSSGYHGFETNSDDVSLEEDLVRRDLTINSIAIDHKGTYIDPFNGQEDIKNKILRHTSDAFADDAVRVLRLARFAAKYYEFTIAEETMAFAKTLKQELLETPKERILLELRKALKTERPSRFFMVLKELDMLEVIPHVDKFIGLVQNPKHHGEGDVFNHVMYALDKAPVDVRLAVLYHDIGKIVTKDGFTYRGHDDANQDMIKDVKSGLKLTNKDERLIKQVIAFHHKFRDIHTFGKRGVYRLITDRLFPRDLVELINVCQAIDADSHGRLISTIDRCVTETEFENLLNGESIDGFIDGEDAHNSILVHHLHFFNEILFLKKTKLEFPENATIQIMDDVKRHTYYKRIDELLNELNEKIRAV